MPRPASTTVMTNLQRGNIQAETTPAISDLSWFTLAGRGDITEEQLQEMVAQGVFCGMTRINLLLILKKK